MTSNIENYRGFEIWFDTELESFQCDIDDSRSIKKSYSGLKKFIDEYLKENNTFKVLRVIPNPQNRRYGYEKITKVIGIRKDGRFIGETATGEKIQISDYDLDRVALFDEKNEPFIKLLNELNKEERDFMDLRNKKEKEILAKIQVVTLKEYKKSLQL